MSRRTLPPAWLTPVLQGVTIGMLIVFAFWFSTISKTIEQTAKTVGELRTSQFGK